MASSYWPLSLWNTPRLDAAGENTQGGVDTTETTGSISLRRPRPLSKRLNSSGNLNPQATDFVPTSPRPSKRKASSSAKSGKSTTVPGIAASSSRSIGPSDPILKASDINSGGETSKAATPVPTPGPAPTPAPAPSELAPHYQMIAVDHIDLGFPSPFPQPDVVVDDDNDDDDDDEGDAYDNDDIFAVIRPPGEEARQRKVYSAKAVNSLKKPHLNPTAVVVYKRPAPKPGMQELGTKSKAQKTATYKILPSCRRQIDSRLEEPRIDSLTWPERELPMELFEAIAAHLSREDVKTLRLVNREFESKVSPSLFKTAVVPFNTELYDMIGERTKVRRRSSSLRNKGKDRARDLSPLPLDSAEGMRLHWQNARDDKEDKVYRGHGLRVFEGFGPHIRRFGMSFEVFEAHLANPPEKKELDQFEAYHGKYDWPPQHYARFANLAGLEQTADETSRMVAAFSKLAKVQELGLSIVSGLGRLDGPDCSSYSSIFTRPYPIFDDHDGIVDRKTSGSGAFWLALKKSHNSIGGESSMKEQMVLRKSLPSGVDTLSGLRDSVYRDPDLWPSLHGKGSSKTTSETARPAEDSRIGVMILNPNNTDVADSSPFVSPSTLRKEQKEWLLETEWAQRAFLESYILAVVDNPNVCRRITTLNIAKISSGLLPLLDRTLFWQALPNLQDVTLHVHPDWRTVQKDSAGYAETPYQPPSHAVSVFHHLIFNQICRLESVKTLRIGYSDGGEHAKGIYGRNNNVLPSPVVALQQATTGNPTALLQFPYVESLEMYNCWMTPFALEKFVKQHAKFALKVLTLNSVSLTADSRIPPGQQPAPAPAPNVQNPPIVFNAQPAPPPLPNNPMTQAGAFAQQPVNPGMQLPAPAPQGFPGTVAAFNGQAQPYIPAGQAQYLNGLGTHALPPAVQPPAPAPPPPAPATSPRKGSWPHVLNAISPGPILTSHLPPPEPWEPRPPPRPATNLKSLILISCGHVRLPHATQSFDQSAFDPIIAFETLTAWFRARQSALKDHVMVSKDSSLGKIVQGLPGVEAETCRMIWGLDEGWGDEVAAEGVEFDGLMPGGTGRITGRIWKGMGVPGGIRDGEMDVL